MSRDPVPDLVRQWRRERPDLDPAPLLVFARIEHLAAAADARLRPPFTEAGLGNGDFNVLAALRRAGAPYQLSPGDLSRAMVVTTGAVTKRIDRLEARGLVQRGASDNDGRARTVTLTPPGLQLADRLIEAHLANERALLQTLTPQEVTQLARLLGKLAESL